ncbi:hypothetical protein [Dysgonomonas sp. 520]|uniref:hypothetical protein n=1 Tax=Dysgonomonas sp. 520 TaxID=2302931 RepID=UPI0013D28959|nr:hypothetical protein [Dysgonomonas sp. 520]NDW09072.1 hypothetical protein [Dysgonomonas sp. 520]
MSILSVTEKGLDLLKEEARRILQCNNVHVEFVQVSFLGTHSLSEKKQVYFIINFTQNIRLSDIVDLYGYLGDNVVSILYSSVEETDHIFGNSYEIGAFFDKIVNYESLMTFTALKFTAI